MHASVKPIQGLLLFERRWSRITCNSLTVVGAASVNYKDIMLATGKLQREADANNGALGFEWSGRVRAVCLTAHFSSSAACAPSV